MAFADMSVTGSENRSEFREAPSKDRSAVKLAGSCSDAENLTQPSARPEG